MPMLKHKSTLIDNNGLIYSSLLNQGLKLHMVFEICPQDPSLFVLEDKYFFIEKLFIESIPLQFHPVGNFEHGHSKYTCHQWRHLLLNSNTGQKQKLKREQMQNILYSSYIHLKNKTSVFD